MHEPGDPALILVTDQTSLDEAEPYGEFLSHSRGHYEIWEKWSQLGPRGLEAKGLPVAVAWHEYEHFPRGRIVHHVPERRFIVYADRRLQRPEIIDAIAHAFALPPGSFTLKSDPHYRSR